MLFRTLCLWMLLLSSAFGGQKVVVVVDDSGSMADRMRYEGIRKMSAAKNSLRVVLDKLPEDAEVGVLALNRGWITKLKQLDRGLLEQQIGQLRASGGTPLGMRMKEATDKLLQLRKQDPYGDYRLLVVTDGEASDQGKLNAVLPDIMSRHMIVDVIGVDMQSEHSLATEVTNYRRADDPDSLEEAIAESLAESDDADDVGAESDFELLSALPVDVAALLLSQIATVNNEPIEEATPATHDSNSSANRTVFQPNSGQGRGGSGGGGFKIGGMFCMVALFFAISVISSIFKRLSRPARPRRW